MPDVRLMHPLEADRLDELADPHKPCS